MLLLTKLLVFECDFMHRLCLSDGQIDGFRQQQPKVNVYLGQENYHTCKIEIYCPFPTPFSLVRYGFLFRICNGENESRTVYESDIWPRVAF